MRLTRSPLRRAAVMIAASGLAAGIVCVAYPSAASASPAEATTLAESLGDKAAGTYLDRASGKMVVAVTDHTAAAKVRVAGATPKIVARGQAQLDRAKADLYANARIPGTAWADDPVTNQVVVSYDSTVAGASLDQLKAVVSRLGDTARLEAVPGTFSKLISGGDAIWGGGYRCSLGFNVRNGSGTNFFLTAGHCGEVASAWYSNSARTALLGNSTRWSFPGNDYAIVQYSSSTSASISGAVGSQDITSSATPAVNANVTRRGSTTGIHTGRVTALNATVNYVGDGTVSGLIRTTVCAQPGDSGGALYQGTTAYGLTSGGSGNCSSGGTTFFQPVTEALQVYGVSVF